MDWVEPTVCTDEHLDVDANTGVLGLARWSVPRLVADVVARSTGDGKLTSTTALPGKLLIDADAGWVNDTPVDHMVLIRVTRAHRSWLVSNPNAIQFRDRWTWAIDRQASEPVTTSIFNSQTGSAVDIGTNSVAEPNPGRQWVWSGANSGEEWIGPVGPNQSVDVRYRCYVWTPPPWSDNANKNSPQHEAAARWSRIQLIAFPQQSRSVTG